MDETNTIGNKIRKFRKEQNMSQNTLATNSGINISTIKKYESGYRTPKPDQLLKISTALGVSINEFLDFDITSTCDVMSMLMKLDKQTDMHISGEKDEDGNYIPNSITITFADPKINDSLATYLSYKESKKVLSNKMTTNTYFIHDDDLDIELEHTRNQLLISTDDNDK